VTLDIGLHDAILAEDYHADPALSSGIAKLLIDRSPAHAWTAHPSLNPAWEREVEDKFDIGTAAHRLLLEGEDCIVEGDYKDWRSKEAKEFKEDARALNQIPLLIPQARRVREMVEKGRMQMDELHHDLDLFLHGKPEQTICCVERGSTGCTTRRTSSTTTRRPPRALTPASGSGPCTAWVPMSRSRSICAACSC
jgi:hypothetical protein